MSEDIIHKEQSIELAVLATELRQIRKDLDDIKGILSRSTEQFVTRAEFEPVRNLVYGIVAAVLLAFIGGLTAILWNVSN